MKARSFRVKCLVSFNSTPLCLERLHFAALHCAIISIPAIPNTMGWIKTAGEALTTCCCGCCQTIWLCINVLKKEIQTAEKSQGLVVPRGSSVLLKTKKINMNNWQNTTALPYFYSFFSLKCISHIASPQATEVWSEYFIHILIHKKITYIIHYRSFYFHT